MPKRNIVWIMVLAVIAVLLWKVPEPLIRRDTLYKDFSPLLDVLFQVRKNYVEEPKSEVLLHGAIDGMLGRLDPYSQYFDADEYRQFQKVTEGQFVGIGIEVGEIAGMGLQIVAPIEGAPAYKAGLRAGDRILKIDGKPAANMKVTDAVELIQGKPGTSVTLTISRQDREEPFDVTVTRGLITVRTVRGWARSSDWEWDYLIDPEDRIGYVRISSFEKFTGEQLDEVLRELLAKERIRGLIIDLRDNPGGLLDVVVDIASRFIPSGVIVTTRGRNSQSVYHASGKNLYPNIPLVVLVNGGSASASEILSGALRDHGRAVLIGEQTFGKGSVQEMKELKDNRGAVKLTTAYYYLPNGERIHGRGVAPDRRVSLTAQERTEMIESHIAVYSTKHAPESRPHVVTTEPAAASQPAGTTQPAPTTRLAPGAATAPASAPSRVEVVIDRQLREALQVLKGQLATRPAGVAAG
ncbi:MAG TPA: S41 family peptidase [Phycisphaerae bacterium]|jgi:carboxyl-terminal processing protease|nr:S41 family peptidase [Phycisphaerae bacterium]HOB73227.1 S41 family peptidase [Phycisphaerae bacterium]HOJ54861.1 S41 family peptidase [Phycisphaerae bacterium]HOL26047.1 S41 family peptidase [Phycisphaerae bacterium]HPP21501.1 S41 family peptidase [Phycisphaerae bacterium]